MTMIHNLKWQWKIVKLETLHENLWNCKRLGMIKPNMATTLAYIFTDADISNEILKKL